MELKVKKTEFMKAFSKVYDFVEFMISEISETKEEKEAYEAVLSLMCDALETMVNNQV